MEWLKANQRRLARILAILGAILLLGGIAFCFLDAKLESATGTNARQLAQTMDGMRSLAAASNASSGQVNAFFQESADSIVENAPQADRLAVRAALLFLPLLPDRVAFIALGAILLTAGLLLSRVRRAAPARAPREPVYAPREPVYAPRASSTPPSAAPTKPENKWIHPAGDL